MSWQPKVRASNGKDYEWYQQDKENSCGCASILMLVYLMQQGKKLDEATVRRWMGQIEGGQNTSKEGVRSFDNLGGYVEDYGRVISEKLGISVHTLKNAESIRKLITIATARKPLLAHVFWDGGGGHTVVVADHYNTSTIFIDPALGVVEIPDDQLLTYKVKYSGADTQGSISFLTEPVI